jgi:hypothetical protein
MFKRAGVQKAECTEAMLLTSRQECRHFLESFCQFPGLNVKSDAVHVDHVRPISSFNLSDPLDVAECFSYANLQLLPAGVNLSKGKKFDAEAHAETVHAWICAEQRLEVARMIQ